MYGKDVKLNKSKCRNQLVTSNWQMLIYKTVLHKKSLKTFRINDIRALFK